MNPSLMQNTLRFSTIAAILAAPLSLSAQTSGTWNSNSNGNWSDPTKWADSAVASGAGAVATFNNTTFSTGRTITLDSNRTIGEFRAVGTPGTARAIIVSGANTLTFNNGANNAVLSNTSNGAVNIQSAITLESSLDISNNPSTDNFMSISGGLSSATAGLKIVTLATSSSRFNLASTFSDGAGQVALVVNAGSGGEVRVTTGQSFTGGLTIKSGEYRLFAGSTSSSFGAGNVTLNGGGIEFNAGFTTGTISNNLAVGAGGGAIETFGTSSITWSGAISGSGALGKMGAGTLLIGNQNDSYSGNVTVSAGTLQTDSLGTLGTADVSVLADSTLTLGNSLSLDNSSALTFTLTSIINLNYAGTMSIADLGLGATFIDAGTYTATELNDFFGGSNFAGIGSINVVPEPQSLALVAIGIFSLTTIYRRRSVARL